MPTRPQVAIEDFPGMADPPDAADLPPGAAEEQVNCLSIVGGELTTRRGYRYVTFEAE